MPTPDAIRARAYYAANAYELGRRRRMRAAGKLPPPIPRTRLTLATVQSIRASYTGRRGEIAATARRYGVSWTAVYLILRNERWVE
jgi:hypothetical protein